MLKTDDEIIAEVIEREGGYVNDPADPGGPTKYGITLKTLQAWRGRPVTAQDVEGLSEGEAGDIYREQYIHAPRLDRIADDKLRGLLVDIAVNHGPDRAVKMLQTALKVQADGVIGPKTMQALFGAKDPRSVYAGVCANRMRERGRLVAANPSLIRFIRGWLNRDAEFVEDA